jgi:pimeloyl-ACP methyl ester carboxylesterase
MAGADFTLSKLDIGGLKFHYVDWGGDGPPLVTLHGLSGHARRRPDRKPRREAPHERARTLIVQEKAGMWAL